MIYFEYLATRTGEREKGKGKRAGGKEMERGNRRGSQGNIFPMENYFTGRELKKNLIGRILGTT